MIYILIFSIFASNISFSQNLGEYYEYDTEGSKARQMSREALSSGKKIIKKPFSLSKHGASKIAHGIYGVVKQVKDFIKHNHVDYQQNKTMINNALSGWQDLVLRDPSMSDKKITKQQALVYFPNKMFHTLQTTLIRLGIRLPMHILDGIRGTINGAMNGFLK